MSDKIQCLIEFGTNQRLKSCSEKASVIVHLVTLLSLALLIKNNKIQKRIKLLVTKNNCVATFSYTLYYICIFRTIFSIQSNKKIESANSNQCTSDSESTVISDTCF